MDVDVVETPVGPVTVELVDGRVARLCFGGRAGGGRRLPQVRRWLSDWFAGRPVSPPLALEDATAFERRVYAQVRAIPRGRTRTYGEVADRIGAPGAARAVGQAMGKNPVCLFIPCHRVVAANGLGGFGGAPGSSELKRTLLSLEGSLYPLSEKPG
ncbi:MAG TPA: methylated-DNA--[protein]-cysteine S-methyltransferase [Planctomycetota bacterium]|nr:methylated-DNA--[protein]-cysteine S-methyltransferase [Planctomycetota bacterium]